MGDVSLRVRQIHYLIMPFYLTQSDGGVMRGHECTDPFFQLIKGETFTHAIRKPDSQS